MNEIISRPFPKTMSVSWRQIMICSLLVVLLCDHGQGNTANNSTGAVNKNQTSDLTVHCWQTRNCTGSILQSFRQQSNGCKYGCMSYIRGSKTDLEKILTSNKKLHLKYCVPCPTQSSKKATMLSKCTSKSCPPNHKCILGRQGIVICLNCSKLRCKKSGILCGTDGKTYKNECDMMCLSSSGNVIKEAYQGPCQAKPTCKTIKCKAGWKCKSSLQLMKPARCYSSGFVCGSDGYTYTSIRELFKIMFCSIPTVKKARDGRCHPSDKPRIVKKSCFLQFKNSVFMKMG